MYGKFLKKKKDELTFISSRFLRLAIASGFKFVTDELCYCKRRNGATSLKTEGAE